MRLYVPLYYPYVLILLNICPHTTVSVLILLCLSSFYHVCVLILLYMCPHSTIYVSFYIRWCARLKFWGCWAQVCSKVCSKVYTISVQQRALKVWGFWAQASVGVAVGTQRLSRIAYRSICVCIWMWMYSVGKRALALECRQVCFYI